MDIQTDKNIVGLLYKNKLYVDGIDNAIGKVARRYILILFINNMSTL